MLGGSTVLLFLGLPVALSFLVINVIGAWLFLGGEPGLVQLERPQHAVRHPEDRVERAERVLEHHRDLPAVAESVAPGAE